MRRKWYHYKFLLWRCSTSKTIYWKWEDLPDLGDKEISYTQASGTLHFELDGLVTEGSFHKTRIHTGASRKVSISKMRLKTRVPDLWLVSSLPNVQLRSSLDVQWLGAAVTCVTVRGNFDQLCLGDTVTWVTASRNSEIRNSANIKSWGLRAVRGTCRNTGGPPVSQQSFQTMFPDMEQPALQTGNPVAPAFHVTRGINWEAEHCYQFSKFLWCETTFHSSSSEEIEPVLQIGVPPRRFSPLRE